MLRVSLVTLSLTHTHTHSRGTHARKEGRGVIKTTFIRSNGWKYRAFRGTSARSGVRRYSEFYKCLFISLATTDYDRSPPTRSAQEECTGQHS